MHSLCFSSGNPSEIPDNPSNFLFPSSPVIHRAASAGVPGKSSAKNNSLQLKYFCASWCGFKVLDKKSEYSYTRFSNTGMVSGFASLHDKASHITKTIASVSGNMLR